MSEVIENEDGELVLQFPVELLNQMGWDEHTILEWVIDEDEVFLKEKNDA